MIMIFMCCCYRAHSV